MNRPTNKHNNRNGKNHLSEMVNVGDIGENKIQSPGLGLKQARSQVNLVEDRIHQGKLI